MPLRGATALHARFRALLRVPDTVEESWAKEAARLIRDQVPQRTGKTARSVRATRQGVTGSPVVTILDQGAKAHTVEARNKQALKFNARTGVVFSRKARKPQQRGRNFVRPAEREALQKVGSGVIVDTWNKGA